MENMNICDQIRKMGASHQQPRGLRATMPDGHAAFGGNGGLLAAIQVRVAEHPTLHFFVETVAERSR